MPNKHNIDIEPSDVNMLQWGDLVVKWILKEAARPTNVKDFNLALEAAGVDGKADGADDRGVEIRDYDGTGNIIIPIPSKVMVEKDWMYLMAEWDAGNKTYPTPDFYRFIFQGNPAKRNLTRVQMKNIAKMRLGEYVINECM